MNIHCVVIAECILCVQGICQVDGEIHTPIWEDCKLLIQNVLSGQPMAIRLPYRR
jgi:hypothetical protein